jgi:hypothetical protein
MTNEPPAFTQMIYALPLAELRRLQGEYLFLRDGLAAMRRREANRLAGIRHRRARRMELERLRLMALQ